MKKLLSIVVMVAVLLALVLAGCSEQADIPTVPEETPQIEEVVSEPTEEEIEGTTTPEETLHVTDDASEATEQTPKDEEVGLIIGDVLYNDIPISQLFTEPFLDVLGEPIGQRDAFYFYEVLEVMGDHGDIFGYDNMAIGINVRKPDLGLLTLNGISLDMTRAELIATLGATILEHDQSLIMYRVSSGTIEYMLGFRFESQSDDEPVSNIEMWREAEQHLIENQ